MKDTKTAARKAAFAARAAAHGTGLDEAANRELTSALTMLGVGRDMVVSGYMPMRSEISPLATMTILYGQEVRVCVPVIVGKGLPLEFHEWEPGAEMIDGPFGAQVPKSGTVLVPDLLITPLLAFDSQGYRLGYGGGFYDRTLAALSSEKPVKSVGFAYGVQQVGEVPREATDWRLDVIVTEAGMIRI